MVLGSTGSGEGAAKIALELRLPMFQSFLKVRLGREEGGRGGVVTRPPGEVGETKIIPRVPKTTRRDPKNTPKGHGSLALAPG